LPGRWLKIALAFAALVLLASCGGGEERSDEQEIRAMLRESDEQDPRNCVRFQTLAFNEQATKEKGDAAIEACEEQEREEAEEGTESEAKLDSLRVNDGRATITATVVGAEYGGQTLEVLAVERDGRWKLHRVVRFVDLRRAKLVAQLGVQVMEETHSAVEREISRCVIEKLGRLSGAAVEDLLLGSSWRPLLEITETCTVVEPPAQPI
jgi:hypothetical protein